MVYEHLFKCFIPKDPSSGFSKLFQVVVVIHKDISKSVALMLRASRLLAMAKDIGGFCVIAIGEVFLRLISRSIVLQLQGHFRSTFLASFWSIDPWRL
jgi:hypothetical protein